ncbi:hypothetical protein WDU94_003560, partial [Cyamophila willieti]
FQANYSSSGRNEIVLTPKTLSTALRNFHTHQAEITLAVDSRKTIINNFDDKTLESTGQNIRSQLSLHPAEFTAYRIGLDTAVNFTVREIKAMLAFAENVSGVLKITFDEPTKPIVFNVSEAGMYEANYILATDASESMSTIGSSTGSEASSSLGVRGRPVRRVFSSTEDDDLNGEAKRLCTSDVRENNNNDGKGLMSDKDSRNIALNNEEIDDVGNINDMDDLGNAFDINCDHRNGSNSMLGVNNVTNSKQNDDLDETFTDLNQIERSKHRNDVNQTSSNNCRTKSHGVTSNGVSKNQSNNAQISSKDDVRTNERSTSTMKSRFDFLDNILDGDNRMNEDREDEMGSIPDGIDKDLGDRNETNRSKHRSTRNEDSRKITNPNQNLGSNISTNQQILQSTNNVKKIRNMRRRRGKVRTILI